MQRRGAHHSRVGAVSPRRTAFDLSYEKKYTCSFAELIPVMCDEVVPGDHFTLSHQTVLRTQPMFAPLLHEVTFTVHAFFVPYRLLWEHWEDFISGGPDGKYVGVLPRAAYSDSQTRQGSLWDYFGFPISEVDGGHYHPHPYDIEPGFLSSCAPMAFPFRAYNFIWEEYYRDENCQPKVGYASWNEIPDTPYPLTRLDNPSLYGNRSNRGGFFLPYHRNWVKDYFTAALPFQQRGQQPAFPISGTLPVQFVNSITNSQGYLGQINTIGSLPYPQAVIVNNPPPVVGFPGNIANGSPVVVGPAYVNLGNGVSFNVNDLRHIVQLQKWMERNARGGIRYTELLKAHFNVAPRDERLQRPEYIGGSRSNIVVSEVLQTDHSAGNGAGDSRNTPQGNMAGHGIMVASGKIGKYFAKEYGLIMVLASIMPTPSYEDGIDRQWLRQVNTDFYWPEFVNLSEQAIYNAEIWADGMPSEDGETMAMDWSPWAFQPQYDEMRIKRNIVCSEFRVQYSGGNLAFWHLGRSFTSLPPWGANFNQLQDGENLNRPFAVANHAPFMVSHANIIKAVRPLPYIGEPGLVDHH